MHIHRSLDLSQSSGDMETLTNLTDSTPAGGSRWVLLNKQSNEHDRESSADAKTTASSCTSSGQRFTVSFSVAAPPAPSSFHGHWVRGDGVGGTPASDDRDDDHHCSYSSYAISDDRENSKDPELKIIAAHDGAMLIEMVPPVGDSYSASAADTSDYFLYEAGAGRRRPPSLSLLPDCYIPMQCHYQFPTATPMARDLSVFNATGILRRGDGEVLVAQLETPPPLNGAPCKTAELCVLRLRPGGHDHHDWVLKRVPIVHHEGDDGELWLWSEMMDAVVPVGSRFMCWVDYSRGFLVCDMAEENPKLRFVPLPVKAPQTRHRSTDRLDEMNCCRWRNMAAAGAGAVRFVSVAPRCCCGGAGTTTCERSSSAFNVTTWTLALRMDEPTMAWVKDGVLDCDELWRLPNYGCLPRVALVFPVVCPDNADVVCFTVREYPQDSIDDDGADDETTVWMVKINTRSKALLSVFRSDNEDYDAEHLLPVKLDW
jgi:hypothetical protein